MEVQMASPEDAAEIAQQVIRIRHSSQFITFLIARVIWTYHQP